MYGEENIYNLIPREFQEQGRAARHKSKFKSTVKDEYTKTKAPNKTMGPAKVQTRAPNEFLKKYENTQPLTGKEEHSFHYGDEEHRKPPVPKHDEKPIMGLKTEKNFITQNAVQNIMSVPKKPEKNYVDTRKGDKHLLDPSGLEPKYIKKKEFGDVPTYLTKRKEEIARAQAEYDAYVADSFRRGAMAQLGEEERAAILKGLKYNWEQLHHEYQGLSVVTDTAPKKNHKERMEAEMKQLERDIETIEKHRVIYIAN